MNNEQLSSLVRTVLKIIGALLVKHGLTDEATLLNTPDALGSILLIIGMVGSHWSHSSDTSSGNGGSKKALLLALTLPALMFTGCASATGNAYKGEAAADITITAAMTAWGDYVAQNHPSAAVEAQVRAAFEKYQAAELLAIDATALNTTNTTAATQAMTNSLSDIIALLQKLGVKI